MADPTAGIPIRVVIGAQSLQAEMIIPPIAEASDLTPEQCLEVIAGAEVLITDDVRRRVSEALGALQVGQELRAVIAESVEPQHANHGRIQWHVGPEADRPAPARSAADTDDPDAPPGTPSGADARVDHYARSSYTMVSAGQVLGVIIPPTNPIDGHDVKGRPLRGKAGKPARLRHDNTIEIDDEGSIRAACDGVLANSLGKWGVRDYLQIPGSVDFSTGNIEFVGHIEVVRGVRDCFRVSAEGNLVVLGLVEAAHLRTGGDLFAQGGVAARERGSLDVQGDLCAKYLDGARAEVGGTLRVAREIINCKCVVHGDVESPNATLIGGVLTPTGVVRLAALGSPAGAPTRLVLNTVPRLEPKLVESERLIAQLLRHIETMAPGSPEAARAGERIVQLEQTRDRLRQTIDAMRTVNVWVSLAIYHRTEFVVDGRVWLLRHDIEGPVTIRSQHDGTLNYRLGKSGEPRPFAELCDPDVKTAA